jgi:hypothetical protein
MLGHIGNTDMLAWASTVYIYRPLNRTNGSNNQFKKGAFTGPVWPNNSHSPARLNFEGEVFEGILAAVGRWVDRFLLPAVAA